MKRYAENTKLTITNAQFYAFHGVRNEERTLGGRYAVDAEIVYNASHAVVSDDLSDTINYEEVLFQINERMNGEPYNLIETLAFDIAVAIIEHYAQVKQVTIRVRKHNVPIQQVMDHVCAEITVNRDE